MEFRDTKLYACGAEGGEVAGLVRLDGDARGRWEPSMRAITWVNPGGRQRAYEVARVVADDADRFAFVDDQGRQLELRELTPDFYNERVRRPQDPVLLTNAELMLAFETSLG